MSAEQKHTPEPWHYESDDRHDSLTIWATRSGNDDKGIATLYGFGPRSEREANAARIVACVNACAGMADPVTEITRLKADLLALRQNMVVAVAKPDGGAVVYDLSPAAVESKLSAKLMEMGWLSSDHRDELLEVLRDVCDRNWTLAGSDEQAAMRRARDILAKYGDAQ